MMDGIKEESVGFLFNVEVQVDQAAPAEQLAATADAPVVEAPPAGDGLGSGPVDPPAVGGAPGAGGTYGSASPTHEPGGEPPLSGAPTGENAPNEPLPDSAPGPVVAQPETPAIPAPAAAAPPAAPAALLPKELTQPHRPAHVSYSAPSVDGGSGITAPANGDNPVGPRSMINAGEGNVSGQVTGTGPARNGPCPCGSGRKYKKCHGAPGGVAAG
jgi:preprotein translocase subunit SecA